MQAFSATMRIAAVTKQMPGQYRVLLAAHGSQGHRLHRRAGSGGTVYASTRRPAGQVDGRRATATDSSPPSATMASM